MPIQVSGLVICQKCYNYQLKGMEETKEKEEKPDFGDLATKKIFMEPRKEELRKEQKMIPELKPVLKCSRGKHVK